MSDAHREILLVEDDDDIRDSMQMLLEYEGYHIETAVNGRDALERLNRAPLPDLILLDLMMPVMTGAELLEVIRSDERLCSVPVVIVSAWPKQAMSIPDAQGFLNKPIEVEALLEIAEEYAGS